VTARVSIRIVPDQALETIATSVQQYLKDEFKKMKSPNTLEVRAILQLAYYHSLVYTEQVSITRTADWWLGNLDDFWFKALEDAVRDEWGIEPLRIREGGVSDIAFFFCTSCLTLWDIHSPSPQSLTSRRNFHVMPSICHWDRVL
jgi:hypothetical protein